MEAEISKIYDKDLDKIIYPETKMEAVYDADGNRLDNVLNKIGDDITTLNSKKISYPNYASKQAGTRGPFQHTMTQNGFYEYIALTTVPNDNNRFKLNNEYVGIEDSVSGVCVYIAHGFAQTGDVLQGNGILSVYNLI